MTILTTVIPPLPPACCIRITETLFQQADAISERFGHLLTTAALGHTDAETIDAWGHSEIAQFKALETGCRQRFPTTLHPFFDLCRSSYGQSISNLDWTLECLKTKSSPKIFKELADVIIEGRLRHETVHGKLGYTVSESRHEVASRLSALLFSAYAYHPWRGSHLFFLPWKLDIEPDSQAGSLLDIMPWPPSPANTVFRSLKRILGWKIELTFSEHVRLRINFP
ncbi:MAG: hypothetical protein HY540_05980 [Deltaproteobacteria bacterium]|nr:hypothetical protein [Deltaproteobacteria bacterium]